MCLGWIALAILCLQTAFGIDQGAEFQSLNMDRVSPERWGLPASDKYSPIVEISENNFVSKVMECDDVWIVIFHRNGVMKKWKDVAKNIGGAVWVGSVDIELHLGLAEKMGISVAEITEKSNMAVVFPLRNGKKYIAMEDGLLKSSGVPSQAMLLASEYIPDKTTDLTFAEDQMQKFNDWVVKGYYYEQPSKFPVICLIDEKQTPLHVRVAAYYLASHFNFGVVKKRDVAAMRTAFKQVPEPQVYPTFLVLLGKEPSAEEMKNEMFQMRFNVMPFIDKKYGDPNLLTSLLNFLFVANSDYRKNLPGRDPAEPAEISKMDGIRNKLKQRFDKAMKSSPRQPTKHEL